MSGINYFGWFLTGFSVAIGYATGIAFCAWVGNFLVSKRNG